MLKKLQILLYFCEILNDLDDFKTKKKLPEFFLTIFYFDISVNK